MRVEVADRRSELVLFVRFCPPYLLLISLVSFRNLNPSRCGGINDAVPFKLRIRGAGACDPCVGSANRAGYAMSAVKGVRA